MRRNVIALCLLCVLTLLTLFAVVGCSKGAYVGSNLSSVYHDPTCVWAEGMESDREVWFETAEDAEAAGYSPCGTCLGTD